jgi:hypothetical protein
VPEDRQHEGPTWIFQLENTAFGYHHDENTSNGMFMDNAARILQDA